MNSVQRTIGSLLLASVLLFGMTGVVVNALEGQPALFEQDEVYIEECGACHLAYAPDLLPVTSWQRVMAGLEDHFGESAELDSSSADHISSYLASNGLTRGNPSRMSRLLRGLPEPPPLRITELPSFVNMHYLVARQLKVEALREGFLSPCADCHREAELGIYDKERLHPGYGPSVWGGAKENAESG